MTTLTEEEGASQLQKHMLKGEREILHSQNWLVLPICNSATIFTSDIIGKNLGLVKTNSINQIFRYLGS